MLTITKNINILSDPGIKFFFFDVLHDFEKKSRLFTAKNVRNPVFFSQI